MDLRSPRDDVPDSPSLLLRFLERATGRRKRPPLPWISSFRFARSPLFSPLPSFPPRWNRTRSRSKFKSERETFTRDTRETKKLRFLASKISLARFVRAKKKRTFFILDLRFHVVDRVRRLHLERDRLSGQRFHENLHCFVACWCSLLSRARVSNE